MDKPLEKARINDAFEAADILILCSPHRVASRPENSAVRGLPPGRLLGNTTRLFLPIVVRAGKIAPSDSLCTRIVHIFCVTDSLPGKLMPIRAPKSIPKTDLT